MANKFTPDQYTPALFDLAVDINGGLPIKLVGEWLKTQQNHDDALKLLGGYNIKGYSVSSDSAGLTKLTKQKGLMEILAIINQPKQLVYGYGKSIGGTGVGIWAADNTQMFYPESVKAETLLSALLTIQDEVKKNCQIKIGLGAHFGEFYNINGGLYGLDAEAIEEIAENETEGGEIVITQAIYELLPENHNFSLAKKTETPTIIGHLYQVLDGPRLEAIQPVDEQYPIPYSDSFYADLVNYQNKLDDTALGQQMIDKYIQDKVVVLIEQLATEAEELEVSLLNKFSFSTMVKDVGMQLLSQNSGVEIKVVGNLGIYVFDDATTAVNFAKAFRDELTKRNISSRMGIDAGKVLIFDLSGGGKDIAGMPVNVASKISQDKGEFGKLYLSGGMASLVNIEGFKEIKYTVSGVDMTAYEG